jgi:hypothetical protein
MGRQTQRKMGKPGRRGSTLRILLLIFGYQVLHGGQKVWFLIALIRQMAGVGGGGGWIALHLTHVVMEG